MLELDPHKQEKVKLQKFGSGVVGVFSIALDKFQSLEFNQTSPNTRYWNPEKQTWQKERTTEN